MGPVWLARRNRWLAATEALRAHGWPERELAGMADASGSIQQMIGNSMHLASVTACVLVLLACTSCPSEVV